MSTETALSRVLPKRTPLLVPAVIAAAGDKASWRFVEFFTANIRNNNTRAAYARAVVAFLRLVRRARL